MAAGAKKKGIPGGRESLPPFDSCKPFSYMQDGDKNNNGNGSLTGGPGAAAPQPRRDTSAAVSSAYPTHVHDLKLIDEDLAYTTLPCGLRVCKLITGTWQLSGGFGYDPARDPESAHEALAGCVERGFDTFDCSSTFGEAERVVGGLRGAAPETAAKGVYMTRWAPVPGTKISKKVLDGVVEKACERMRCGAIDVLQLHWWDYNDTKYVAALRHFAQHPKVHHVGLANFDTVHLLKVCDRSKGGAGVPIALNEVLYNVVDRRAERKMQKYCKENDMPLIAYGALMGGLLTDRWLRAPEPSGEDLDTPALRKYKLDLNRWGTWAHFQVLLEEMNVIARRLHVSIADVALRWVLQQDAVAAVVLGQRAGHPDGRSHVADNMRVFTFELNQMDYTHIKAAHKIPREQRGHHRQTAWDLADVGDEFRKT